jgi:hypothetical protein
MEDEIYVYDLYGTYIQGDGLGGLVDVTSGNDRVQVGHVGKNAQSGEDLYVEEVYGDFAYFSGGSTGPILYTGGRDVIVIGTVGDDADTSDGYLYVEDIYGDAFTSNSPVPHTVVAGSDSITVGEVGRSALVAGAYDVSVAYVYGDYALFSGPAGLIDFTGGSDNIRLGNVGAGAGAEDIYVEEIYGTFAWVSSGASGDRILQGGADTIQFGTVGQTATATGAIYAEDIYGDMLGVQTAPAGTATQRYMVARGASTSNPAARSDSTAASRRRWNTATFSGTHFSQLSSAPIPPAWTARKTPVSMKLFTLESRATSAAFPTAHPRRQPVMLYVLESEWNSRATSRAPGSSRTLGGRYPSNATSE